MTRTQTQTIWAGEITLISTMNEIGNQILLRIDSKDINNSINLAYHHPLQAQTRP